MKKLYLMYLIMFLLPVLVVFWYVGESVLYDVQVKLEIKEMRESCVEQLENACDSFEKWQDSQDEADYDRGAECFSKYLSHYAGYWKGYSQVSGEYYWDLYDFSDMLKNKEVGQEHMEQVVTAIKGLRENFDDEERIGAVSAILEQIEAEDN